MRKLRREGDEDVAFCDGVLVHEPGPKFSYKELDQDVREIAEEACRYWKMGIKDLIDDPLPARCVVDQNHIECRAEAIYRVAKIPLYIRGMKVRGQKYGFKEIGLFFDRDSITIRKIIKEYRGRFYGGEINIESEGDALWDPAGVDQVIPPS